MTKSQFIYHKKTMGVGTMQKEKAFVEREEAQYNIKEHIISGLVIGGGLVLIVLVIVVVLSII